MNKSAVILLSGGLDSSILLALCNKNGVSNFALTFDYGQHHLFEIEAAKNIASEYKCIEHSIIRINLGYCNDLSLLNGKDIPTGRNAAEIAEGIPNTYVPGRNTIFLSYAFSYAEIVEADRIFIAVNAIDHHGYPDCSKNYFTAFQKLLKVGSKNSRLNRPHIKLETPFIDLDKSEIVKIGLELGVKFELTSSCYNPNSLGEACGVCDSCVLRLKAFSENNIKDPIIYKK